ncbi:hypothetical protein IIY68_02155 [Candidatus Saccharibacteria bacterium]|nr:hypothetical protein [Candidatus Saccharibacteria bacterium]
MKKMKKFKKGAASFYIVAISTLILVIIAASFAAVIISEITRTSNDDLAQSAYDSALAGVEDAKLAYYNYQSCLEGNAGKVALNNDKNISCEEIRYLIEDSNSCDMVAKILGRIPEDNDGQEVLIEEKVDGGANNMQQAYTCVKVTDVLPNYLGTLSSSNDFTKVIKPKFEDTSAANISSIVVSWQADNEDFTAKYSNFSNEGIFGEEAPAPAVISVGLVQTAGTFNLSDFDMTQGDRTDRGTLYLVPTDQDNLQSTDKYEVASNGYIGKKGFLKSNDKTVKNKPYAVYCDNDNDNGGFVCSVTIELPDPVNSDYRSDETFMVVLSAPYANWNFDFEVKFCEKNGNSDGKCVREVQNEDGILARETVSAKLKDVQVGIDSTGRANDLYRRVETRLEPPDTGYPYPLYAIQVLGESNGSLIQKDVTPTCEWNFGDATGPRGLCDNT